MKPNLVVNDAQLANLTANILSNASLQDWRKPELSFLKTNRLHQSSLPQPDEMRKVRQRPFHNLLLGAC